MKQPNNSTRASALPITFSIAAIFVFAILLTSAAPGNPKGTSGQSPLGCRYLATIQTHHSR